MKHDQAQPGTTADVHGRLIAKQPTDELRRKQRKAVQRGIWTQEDIDLAEREGKEMSEALKWD